MGDELRWFDGPTGLVSDDGEFRIEGPVDEPGFKGYKLFLDGKHILTRRLLREAKAEAEKLR